MCRPRCRGSQMGITEWTERLSWKDPCQACHLVSVTGPKRESIESCGSPPRAKLCAHRPRGRASEGLLGPQRRLLPCLNPVSCRCLGKAGRCPAHCTFWASCHEGGGPRARPAWTAALVQHTCDPSPDQGFMSPSSTPLSQFLWWPRSSWDLSTRACLAPFVTGRGPRAPSLRLVQMTQSRLNCGFSMPMAGFRGREASLGSTGSGQVRANVPVLLGRQQPQVSRTPSSRAPPWSHI